MPASASYPPARTLWERTVLFFRILWQRVWVEQSFDQSAALAYHTLFSLLPVFILVVLMLSIVSGRHNDSGGLEDQVRDFLYRQFRLDALSVTDQAGNPINVPDLINQQIERARVVVRNPLTGLIGFAVLVYGASNIMLVVEKAFNRIYNAPAPRSWSRRIMLYWSVLTLGPLLAGASLLITNTFYNYAASTSFARPFLVPVTFLAGFFVTWILMILLYKIVPGTHVRWSAALMGGFVAAVLWEIGKNAIGLYVRTTVTGNNWYGTLALVPLFMFWVYVMWNFTLLGLHISYVYQFYGTLAQRHLYQQHCSTTITDLHWIFPLAVILVRNFRAGTPTTLHDASAELNLPAEITAELLSAVEESKVVYRVERGGYTLARPPESITAMDLINAAKSLCTIPDDVVAESGPSPLHTPALIDLAAHQTAWYRNHTLADLAARPGESRAES